MSERTKIQWCDHTFNPWWGCSQISPGCDHCYAKALAERFRPKRKIWNTNDRLRFGDQHWQEPLRWNRRAWARGRSESVFVGSMCDVFDPGRPLGELERLIDVIDRTPYLDWLLLTKRPGNAVVHPVLDSSNVRLGVTVESQNYIERIGQLLRRPGQSYFLCFEPLLGPIDLYSRDGWESWLGWSQILRSISSIDWVIVGGESGPQARAMNPDWVRAIRDHCQQFLVPFFFKQWSRTSGPKLAPVLDGKTWHQKPVARMWECLPSKTPGLVGAGL